MIKIEKINHKKANSWLIKQITKESWHNGFTKKHLLYLSKIWPQLKKFYKSTDNWLAAYYNNKIVGVYYYAIVENEMYDGYLTTDKKHSKFNIGLNLNKKLLELTKDKWITNWSLCFKKYLSFNKRLGFKVDSETTYNNKIIYLLRR